MSESIAWTGLRCVWQSNVEYQVAGVDVRFLRTFLVLTYAQRKLPDNKLASCKIQSMRFSVYSCTFDMPFDDRDIAMFQADSAVHAVFLLNSRGRTIVIKQS